MRILSTLIVILLFQFVYLSQEAPHFVTFQAGLTQNLWSETAESPNDEYQFSSKIAPSIGIGFFNELGEKFAISGRLHYQRVNVVRSERCLNCAVEIQRESNYKFNYFDIPVNLNYFLLNKQSDVYLIGGIGLRVAISGKNLWRQDVTNSQEDLFKIKEDMRKTAFMANLGVGYKYQLTYTTSFAAEGSFGIHPGSTLKTEQFGLNALNLKFGLYFRLN